MTLRIYDLGRHKKSAQFIVDDGLDADGIAAEIYRAVRRMKALASRNVECVWDGSKCRGTVYAGVHIVGHVEFIATETCSSCDGPIDCTGECRCPS